MQIKNQKQTEQTLIEEQLIKVKKAMEDTIQKKQTEKQELNKSTEEYERRIIDLQSEYNAIKDDIKPVQRQIALIQKENNEKLEEIRKIADELQKLSKQIEDPVTSAANKEALLRERKLQANKGNALENNRRDWLNRRNKAINESIVTEMRKILGQIQDKVEAYARDNDVDMILDKSARGTTQTLFLVFAKDQFDITASLLDTLNKDGGEATEEEAK